MAGAPPQPVRFPSLRPPLFPPPRRLPPASGDPTGQVAEREYRWLDHHPRELPLVWPRTGGTAGGRDEETCEKDTSFGLGGRSPSPSRCRSTDVRRAAREGQHGASMERIHARTVLAGPQWVRTRPPATRLVRIPRKSIPTHPLVWPSPF